MRLDLRCLQDQRFLFGPGEDVVQVGDVPDQGVELAPSVVARFLKIGADSAAQALSLTYIDNLPIPVLHQVDSRAVGQGIELDAQIFGYGLFHLLIQ